MEVEIPAEYRHLYEMSAARPVVKIPAQVLRQKAEPIQELATKHGKILDEMIRAMKLANGVGIAAPQLGYGLRMIVIAPEEKPVALINPEIIESSKEVEAGEEGCLSIPGLYGDVTRPVAVTVQAYDRKGRPVTYEMEGFAARVVQHEVDHLDGILFIDKVDPETLHWQDPDKRSDQPE